MLLEVTDRSTADAWRHTVRWPVRQYELDLYGHVNNAVYLNWIEQAAIDHVEALGFGRDWAAEQGGGWVVREHRVTYHRPVVYGDVVLVTTLPAAEARRCARHSAHGDPSRVGRRPDDRGGDVVGLGPPPGRTPGAHSTRADGLAPTLSRRGGCRSNFDGRQWRRSCDDGYRPMRGDRPDAAW